MAGRLNADDPEERKWYLIALHRADQLERTIRDRRKLVEEQIRLADELHGAGRTDAARSIINKLREQYKDYTDLADLFTAIPEQPATAPSRPGSPAVPPPKPESKAPESEKPSAESGKAAKPPAERPPGPAGAEGETSPSTPDPRAEPKPPGAAKPSAPESPEAGQPGRLQEVNQRFDSEFRS